MEIYKEQMDKKAKTRRTKEEMIICNFNYFFGFVIIHALLPRVGPKLVSLAREINVVEKHITMSCI